MIRNKESFILTEEKKFIGLGYFKSLIKNCSNE